MDPAADTVPSVVTVLLVVVVPAGVAVMVAEAMEEEEAVPDTVVVMAVEVTFLSIILMNCVDTDVLTQFGCLLSSICCCYHIVLHICCWC